MDQSTTLQEKEAEPKPGCVNWQRKVKTVRTFPASPVGKTSLMVRMNPARVNSLSEGEEQENRATILFICLFFHQGENQQSTGALLCPYSFCRQLIEVNELEPKPSVTFLSVGPF